MVDDWKYNEQSLVQACINGNQAAFRYLYQQNAPWMLAICLRYLGDKDLSQDVLQESFVLIYRKLPLFKFEGSLKSWLRKIVTNCALATFRDKHFIHSTSTLLDNQITEVDLDLVQSLDLDELKYLISCLSPGRRQVFVAYVIDGYSHKEIAEMMNISEGTSKSQLHDAKRELKDAIENQLTTLKKI